MNILVCENCDYRASADYINMTDQCPNCKATPFVEKESGVFDHASNIYTPDATEPTDAAIAAHEDAVDAAIAEHENSLPADDGSETVHPNYLPQLTSVEVARAMTVPPTRYSERASVPDADLVPYEHGVFKSWEVPADFVTFSLVQHIGDHFYHYGVAHVFDDGSLRIVVRGGSRDSYSDPGYYMEIESMPGNPGQQFSNVHAALADARRNVLDSRRPKVEA